MQLFELRALYFKKGERASRDSNISKFPMKRFFWSRKNQYKLVTLDYTKVIYKFLHALQ